MRQTPATFLATVLLIGRGRGADHTVPKLSGSHFYDQVQRNDLK